MCFSLLVTSDTYLNAIYRVYSAFVPDRKIMHGLYVWLKENLNPIFSTTKPENINQLILNQF